MKVPSISREYLHVPVTGATGSMPVEIAVVARTAEPVDEDWQAALWDGSDAKLLIGPGTDLALAAGFYSVWVRVTAAPELPVLRSGLLQII